MKARKKVEFDPAIPILESAFVELIRKRLGIVMHTHQNYELFKTIQDACDQLDLTPSDYLDQLSQVNDESPMLSHLVAGITIGETSFFRDSQQMQLLENNLLPELIEKKRKNNTLTLRIWSAGCSTGEEIYSIAMMLNELLPDRLNWTIRLLATDINTAVLQKALLGVYTEWSMRSISDYYKKKYFEKKKSQYILSKTIREQVNFDYLNLNADNYPSIFNGTNAEDLIICRNVLIYIDTESCIQIMKKMNKSLLPGGYLLLGASDPVNLVQTDFIRDYRKPSLFLRSTEENTKKTLKQPIQNHYQPTIKTRIKPPVRVIEKSIKKIIEKKPETQTPDRAEKATELANLGRLQEAIQLCEEGYRAEPANPLNYYTCGLALSELNQLTEAESAFRKTIFLDNQFVAGHFQLGLLLLRKNQRETGLKSLKNALMIAKTKHREEAVPGAPNLCYSDFAEILQNEINLYVMDES